MHHPVGEIEQPIHTFGVEQAHGTQQRQPLLQDRQGEQPLDKFRSDLMVGNRRYGLHLRFDDRDRDLDPVGGENHLVHAGWHGLESEAA